MSRRLEKEAEIFNRKPHPGISILAGGEPWGKNNALSHELLAILDGPQGTPYEKYKLRVVITIPERYPSSQPIVYFKPPIYHPNIDQMSGEPDLQILGIWWPQNKIINILTDILKLLENPEPSHGIDASICQEFMIDRDSYNKKAENSAKASSKI